MGDPLTETERMAIEAAIVGPLERGVDPLAVRDECEHVIDNYEES